VLNSGGRAAEKMVKAQPQTIMLTQEDDNRQAPPPALLVDAMLGRLARWLRLLGFDAEYWREGSDEALIAAAAAQRRLIVTRDRALSQRRGVRAVFVAGDTLEQQIADVRAALGPLPAPFTRCAECNGELVDLPHEAAQGLVPAYVWHTQSTFRQCTRCHRVYWKGTHWPALKDRLGEDET
jgi:uncharacterized protein